MMDADAAALLDWLLPAPRGAAPAWETAGGLLLRRDDRGARGPAAAFDFDGTLVATASGRRFPAGGGDVRALRGAAPFERLQGQGYRLVIISNQLGVGRGRVGLDVVRERFERFLAATGLPFSVACSLADDRFRKPAVGLWEQCEAWWGPLDRSRSFYVGDAAGRPRDFSCSDRKFAHNVGISFQTPEEFFLGAPAAPFSWGGYDPAGAPRGFPEAAAAAAAGRRLVIAVGQPASGKTTFLSRALPGHTRVCQDELKTRGRCLQACERALAGGGAVAVDCTNPAPEDRAPFVALAQKYRAGRPLMLLFPVPPELAAHLNWVRAASGGRRVPEIAYRVFRKRYIEPRGDEGADIERVEFAAQFSDEKERRLFLMRS